MSGRYFKLLVLLVLVATTGPTIAASHDGRRAVLGVNIASGSANGGPAEGVTVVGVTPGGPADASGIRAGDIIVAVDDEALTDGSQRKANRKLLRFMETVEPGDEVRLSFLRDGDISDISVIAGEVDLGDMPGNFPFMRDFERFGEDFRAHMSRRHTFAGMELVSLTKDLGDYFGTDQGLLVVRAPSNDAFEMRDGDVIIEIGGRQPSDPAHAMRILRSYEPGEKLVIDLLRKQRRKELVIRLPEPNTPDS